MNRDTDIRELAVRRHLPDSHLERWLRLDTSSRDAVFEVASALKLRTGQLVAMLDLLDEISVREHRDIATLLARPSLSRIVSGSGSAPERARAFLEELRSMRFPRLRETALRIEAALTALRLPRGIAILLPRELSSDELTIHLKASDAGELERLLDALNDRRADLARIFAMMSGADEV